MIAGARRIARLALIGFVIVCLAVFAFSYPELAGGLIGRAVDGVVGAVEAVVRLIAEVARG